MEIYKTSPATFLNFCSGSFLPFAIEHSIDFWTSKFIVLLLCFVSFLIWCLELEIVKWKGRAHTTTTTTTMTTTMTMTMKMTTTTIARTTIACTWCHASVCHFQCLDGNFNWLHEACFSTERACVQWQRRRQGFLRGHMTSLKNDLWKNFGAGPIVLCSPTQMSLDLFKKWPVKKGL